MTLEELEKETEIRESKPHRRVSSSQQVESPQDKSLTSHTRTPLISAGRARHEEVLGPRGFECADLGSTRLVKNFDGTVEYMVLTMDGRWVPVDEWCNYGH